MARKAAKDQEQERRNLEIPSRGKRKRAVLDAGQEIEYVPPSPLAVTDEKV